MTRGTDGCPFHASDGRVWSSQGPTDPGGDSSELWDRAQDLAAGGAVTAPGWGQRSPRLVGLGGAWLGSCCGARVHDLTSSHGITRLGMGAGFDITEAVSAPPLARLIPPSSSSRRACLAVWNTLGTCRLLAVCVRKLAQLVPRETRFGGAGIPALPVGASGGLPTPPHAPSAASSSQGPASCPVSPTTPCSDQDPLPHQPRLFPVLNSSADPGGTWRLLPSQRLAREAQAHFRSLNRRNTTPSAIPKKCGPIPAFVGHALQVVRGHPRGHPFRDDSCPSWCLGLLPSVCPLTRPPETVSLCLAPSVDFPGASNSFCHVTCITDVLSSWDSFSCPRTTPFGEPMGIHVLCSSHGWRNQRAALGS